MLIASLGGEQFEDAYQYWLTNWNAHDAYSPHIGMNATDLMGEAAENCTPRSLMRASMFSSV
jgi:hypothetical protein